MASTTEGEIYPSMMQNIDPQATFDQAAWLYDKARPRYPDALFTALIDKSQLKSDARLLEIGPGTGQATRPFGSLDEGVRVLVICGRDEVDPSMPTYDQVLAQMNEDRVNMRARRYLRDLRRDAVIDFR